MKKILDKEKIFLSAGVDEAGKVFELVNVKGRVFREIYKNEGMYKDLLNSNELKNLEKIGLIKSNVSESYYTEKKRLLLEHKKLPFINYPFEWSRVMIKEAAKQFLLLSLALGEKGLLLKDSHSFNTVYSEGRPYFVDWGSITSDWSYLDEGWMKNFFSYFIFPLVYFENNSSSSMRKYLLTNLNKGLPLGKLLAYELRPGFLKHLYKYLYFLNKVKVGEKDLKQYKIIYTELKEYVSSIEISNKRTRWSHYHPLPKNRKINKKSWKAKQKSFFLLVKKIKASTVVDFGANTGLYLDIFNLVHPNAKLILLDNDETVVDEAYLAKRYYETLVVNFNDIGRFVPQPSNPRLGIKSFDERYSADLAICLALVHHLILFQNQSMKEVVRKIAKLTKKHLITEFIPPNDFHLRNKNLNFNDYNLQNFVETLKKHFVEISILDSYPQGRKIIYAKK